MSEYPLSQILKIAWQAGIFILLIGLYIKISRLRNPVMKYALWLIAILSVVLIPITTMVFSNAGVGFNFRNNTEVHGSGLVMPSPIHATTGSASVSGNIASEERVALNHVHNALALILSVGILFMFVRLFSSYSYLRDIERNADIVRQPQILERFSSLKNKLNISKNIDIRIASGIHFPITTGVFRYSVLIPSQLFESLSKERIDMVLTHELAHIKRHDFVINFVMQLIQCIFFFHPLIWFANRKLRIEREHICDQWVIHILKEPESYAKCLFGLARETVLRANISPAAVGIMHVKSKIGRRIEMILNIAKVVVPKSTRRSIVITSIMFVAALSIVSWVGSTGEKPISVARVISPSAEVPADRQAISGKFAPEKSLLVLMGIIRPSDKQAIAQVKDLRTDKIYFVKEGEKVGKFYTVKKIQKDKVILSRKGHDDVELKLTYSEIAIKLEQKVSAHFENADLKNVLRYLSEVGKVNIVLDESALSEPYPRVTVHLKDISLREVLDILVRSKGLAYRVEPHGIWISTVENIQMTAQGSKGQFSKKLAKKVSVAFTNTDIRKVISYLGKVSGLNIVVDEKALSGIDPNITIQFSNVSLSDAISIISRQKGLEIIKADETMIQIGKVSGLTIKMKEKLKKIVSVKFSNAHLQDVLSYISQSAGINIVLDEGLYDDEGNSKLGGATDRISIHLEKIPLAEAFQVILRAKGLKYQAQGNLVWITSDKLAN